MIVRILLTLLTFPALLAAGQPWLMSFPDISYSEKNAYFSEEKWTAYYSRLLEGLLTVPRDSLDIPEPGSVGLAAELDDDLYYALESRLSRLRGGTPDTTFVLPDPPPVVYRTLGVSAAGPEPQITEVIDPLCAYDKKVWFGLTAQDLQTGNCLGGIGWFDPALQKFGRVYSPALTGFQPQWIGAVRDTVLVLLAGTAERSSRFISYAIHTGNLTQIDLRGAGIPGEVVLNIRLWDGILLIATDEAVAVWNPGRDPLVWQTSQYAVREPTMLFLKTFPKGDPETTEPVPFTYIQPDRPAEAKAKVGNWIELVIAEGIEAYVDQASWEQNKERWQERFWNCDPEPCFARLMVPMQGEEVPADFTNAPLYPLEEAGSRMKVGFRVAWARADELIPVLVVKRSKP